MSTAFTDLKSNCCQSEENTERASASVENSSAQTEEERSFQETREKKRITRSVSDCIQTTKNLRIRRETLLKSKGEWVSTQERQDECPTQLRFTSSLSLRFPRRNDNRTNIRVATKLNSNDLHTKSDAGTKVADVKHPEFGEKDFLINTLRKPTGEATKDENASKSNTDDTFYPWGGHVKHDISSHISSDVIQHSLVLCDQGQPACGERVTDLRVTEQETVLGQSGINDPQAKNAEGKLSHSNLIPFIEDSGSKGNSDCQVCACLSKAINQTLFLPPFPDSPCSNNLKSDPINSKATMFTSTLVSVLAPHWTARLRRHKRGFGDVGPDIAQNMNLSAASQNEQQQRLPLQQIQAQGEPVNDFSNRFRGSAGTNRSSVDWQNKSFSHLTESKNHFVKTSSLGMNSHAVNQTTEVGVNPIHVSVDFDEGLRSTMSLQLSEHRRTSRPAEQEESFSSRRSRPTTSTLLLSSRRLNSRKPSSESFQMQKQLSASISSLHLPSESILRVSKPKPNLVSPNDVAKETVGTKTFLASSEQLLNTHKPKPSSSEWIDMDLSKDQRYVITGDFERINRNPNATNDATGERFSPFSNYLTRFNKSGTLQSLQDHRPIDWSISDNRHLQDLNTKIPERSAWISPNGNANRKLVFPQVSSDLNSGSILKREISKTSMTSTNLGPSTSVQTNIINNMVDSNKTIIMNGTTIPITTHPMANSPSVCLSPAFLTHTDQNNIQSSSGSCKPSSSPVNSVGMRTFTESLSFSPRKNSFIEGRSPSQLWSIYLNSKRRLEESSQSPLDTSTTSTPSEFKPRRVCTPSIYKYLRETSPPKSTQLSPALSSPSPRTSSLKQIQEEDKNSRNLRFTFDLNSLESNDPLLKTASFTSAPQSLPPDTGRTVPRISKSPYSTLISTRAAANSLSSPPEAHQHSRCFSYSSSPVDAASPKFGKRSYTSVLRDRLSQRTLSVGEPMASTDIQFTKKTHSVCQQDASKIITDAKFPDYQTTLSPDTTHPIQTETISHKAHNDIFLSQVDRNNTYATDSWKSKELSLPLSPSPIGEVVQKGELTEILQTKGIFQASQSLNSMRSFFTRSKKDNVKSSPSSDKEGSADKKGKITGFKTTNKKVFNRLKQTFGGTFLEDSDTTSKRKTKKEEVSSGKVYENILKEKEINELTVKRQNKLGEHLETEASKRTWKLDSMDDLTARTQTKFENVLDTKGPEITMKPVQMDYLTVRTQNKPKILSDIRVPERSQKQDQTDGLTDKRHTEAEKVSHIKGPQRSQKLDQADVVAVWTQIKHEKVSDIKGLEKSQKLDQTVDLTVGKKAKNVMLLDIMPREPPKNAEQKHLAKSSTSLNDQMIDSYKLSSPILGFKHEKRDNLSNLENHKRVIKESRSRLLGRPISPNWPQPDNINCYATLPPGKRSRLGPSLTLSPFDCSLEGHNDNVFFSNVPTKTGITSTGEPENDGQPDNIGKSVGQNSTGVVLSSPCADLMYGLQRKRSVSVSSVVSGRPSGPGRISTGSRQNSISDLSSSDIFVTKSRHSSISSPTGSPENDVISSTGNSLYKGPTGKLTSDSCLRSPDKMDTISFSWDMETDPTPPNSPPHARRISQIPSPTSANTRTSPESLSPRGILPSRNYKSTLSAFEESGSETTTDDEYYLNSDDEDEKETEL